MIKKDRGAISELAYRMNELERGQIISGIRKIAEYEEELKIVTRAEKKMKEKYLGEER